MHDRNRPIDDIKMRDRTAGYKMRDYKIHGQNETLRLNKKLSYRRGTARCVVSIEILPIAIQQCRNYLYDKS